MTKNRREVFSESSDNHVWIEGTTKDLDSKVLLTITNQSGEQTALITPEEILSSKASLFVEAPAERVQVKGKSTFARIYQYVRVAGYAMVAVVITFSLFSFTGAVKARIVLTGSMAPAINPGDIIITTPPSNKTPQKGDVVAYTADLTWANSNNVTSYDVYINGDYYGTDVQKIQITTNDILSITIVRQNDSLESNIKFDNILV